MEQEQKLVVRCRGVILDQGELLVATHGSHEYYALLGGKLEWGENPLECMKRELIEELGIEPVVGRLLYVNSFVSGDTQTVEFLFEILNSADYRDYESRVRTHAHELAGLDWITKDNAKELLPKAVSEDFKNGTLLSDKPRFIYN